MNRPKIVCVLGMHRSGTSVITRALNLLGVYLGPDDHFVKAAPDNPKGFWEHRPIMQLNEQILRGLGADTCDPPVVSSGWEGAPELEELRRQARALLDLDFADAEMWGWKDPRTCLTLPFWQRLLPPMRYVICLRHPLAVARSLEKRDGFSPVKGIYLWLAYTRHALQNTVDQPRMYVFYDRFLDDCQHELRRLAQFVGKKHLADDENIQRAIEEFIDKDLRHHRASSREAADEAQLGVPATVLDLTQQAWTAFKQRGAGPRNAVDRILEEALDLVRPKIEEQKQKAQEQWLQGLSDAMHHIRTLVPPGHPFILVDEEQLDVPHAVDGRQRIPFLEGNGQYWGRPPDDETGIRELERLQRSGPSYIIFAWPAFWWLDYYRGLHQYLRSNFRCVLENDRLVAFDMRT